MKVWIVGWFGVISKASLFYELTVRPRGCHPSCQVANTLVALHSCIEASPEMCTGEVALHTSGTYTTPAELCSGEGLGPFAHYSFPFAVGLIQSNYVANDTYTISLNLNFAADATDDCYFYGARPEPAGIAFPPMCGLPSLPNDPSSHNYRILPAGRSSLVVYDQEVTPTMQTTVGRGGFLATAPLTQCGNGLMSVDIDVLHIATFTTHRTSEATGKLLATSLAFSLLFFVT
eukprot:Gregarina_sp_Poly_1__8243@NODE_47_length_17802_cov_82_087454_g41_i0_p5_GENE_NODE_47_length_17802_cov_82_087454_g41_i0NODE_47_length_17802_cov_82_087454_g41_i0_p5_ORF_typecomplete_len232_score17_76_NODE_47_length_17802_cov_82_087454_g41_i021972892